MKPSDKKWQLVEELTNLCKKLDVARLYSFPRQEDTQEWLAEVAAVLKNLDEGDYQEFVKLSKVITPTEESRETRKKAAYEIKAFITRKVAEYKRYDFSSLDKEEPGGPVLKFGEPGRAGQPGGGGSILIQAETFNMSGGGRISADGGDYITHQSKLNNFGTINLTIEETVNNILKLTDIINKSNLDEAQKRQIIKDFRIIKTQITTSTPDKSILQKAWGAVQAASTIGGAAQLLGLIGQVVLPLLK